MEHTKNQKHFVWLFNGTVLIGAQMDLGQGGARASQWHQCLCYPGTAYLLWPQEARHCPAAGRTQGLPETITDPPPPFMLDVTGTIKFTTASLDSFMSVTRAQCEPAHLWRERGCHSSCTVLGCEHRSHWRMSGSGDTLVESVSDSLVRNIHTNSLLGVIL